VHAEHPELSATRIDLGPHDGADALVAEILAAGHEEVAHALGAAFARVLDARAIVTAHDMRDSSIPLSQASPG